MESKFLGPHTPKTNQYSALTQCIHRENFRSIYATVFEFSRRNQKLGQVVTYF